MHRVIIAPAVLIVFFLLIDASWVQAVDLKKNQANLKPVLKLEGHEEKIRYVTFGPFGKRIATTANDFGIEMAIVGGA